VAKEMWKFGGVEVEVSIGVDIVVESCKIIVFLGGHFLFPCSDTFVEGCKHPSGLHTVHSVIVFSGP